MVSQKSDFRKNPSFRRKPESSDSKKFWTPAFAGVTCGATFSEIINSKTSQYGRRLRR